MPRARKTPKIVNNNVPGSTWQNTDARTGTTAPRKEPVTNNSMVTPPRSMVAAPRLYAQVAVPKTPQVFAKAPELSAVHISQARPIARYTDLNEATNSMAKLRIVENIRTKTFTGPLSDFHLFGKLPTELRLQIWRFARDEPRIIELQRARGVCRYFEVTPLGRRVPAILLVNHEAREEALKGYEPINFDKLADPSLQRPIYFNVDHDIVGFLENSCISTMIQVFRQRRLPIHKIAVHMSTQMMACCNWDRSGEATVQGTGVSGGIGFLQAMHGFHPDAVGGNTWAWPGCDGLREVYFAVKTRLWELPKGEVPQNAILRPAATNGITTGMVELKKKLNQQISLVNASTNLPQVGSENKWEGEKKPKFRFVSLADPKYFGKTHEYLDAIPIDRKGYKKLEGYQKNWKMVQDIEKSTGCAIYVGIFEWETQDVREVGFIGSPEAIAKAKHAVLDFLAPTENVGSYSIKMRGRKHNFRRPN